MLKLANNRAHLWQWDADQMLVVGREDVTEVHFRDLRGEAAMVLAVIEQDGKRVVQIPNALLTEAKPIDAYAYRIAGDMSTLERITIEVKARQRPADYVYTETEVKRWETLEERIAALEQGGADGFSPTVDIEPIDGGHRISITDKDGTQTADVLDGRDGADGYTPVKNVDYFDGQPGAKGDPGDPGADGISPTVAVQDITGGHRVTITDKDGAKTFDVMDGKDGAGGTGGGDSPAIIDVVALPETDAREDVFYRVTTGVFHWGGTESANYKCIVVDSLPVEGVSVLNADMTESTYYYAKDTETANGYVPDWLGAYAGIPSGWYTPEMLTPMVGMDYAGIVKDENQIQDEGLLYLLVKESVNYRNNDKWDNLHGAAIQGNGVLSVVLNTPINQANGENSAAKGFGTIANGKASSAEGWSTVAVGKAQHVQGAFNKLDEIEDNEKSKYLHIVGNGDGELRRSNAHTLDWGGNAWYAGTVECTSVILTSPFGTRYRLTVADDGTLTTAAV